MMVVDSSCRGPVGNGGAFSNDTAKTNGIKARKILGHPRLDIRVPKLVARHPVGKSVRRNEPFVKKYTSGNYETRQSIPNSLVTANAWDIHKNITTSPMDSYRLMLQPQIMEVSSRYGTKAEYEPCARPAINRYESWPMRWMRSRGDRVTLSNGRYAGRQGTVKRTNIAPPIDKVGTPE